MDTAFDHLPLEILYLVVASALPGERVPSNILRVSRPFHSAGMEWLYRDLLFCSQEQLKLFALRSADAGVVLRSLTVDLAGKQATPDVWRYLYDVLSRCRNNAADGGEDEGKMERRQIAMEMLCLRLHSYARDWGHHVFEEALLVTNPRVFRWTGPDPDHHFSTAIVAPIADRLCRVFGTWSNIQHITVTNIAFSSQFFGTDDSDTPLLPEIPSLRTLYIGQATFLRPGSVAALFYVNRMANLEGVRLVDTYCQSIWGPRVRRSDVEKAAQALMVAQDALQSDVVLARIRKLLTCEKKTERIIGGDRVEDNAFLI